MATEYLAVRGLHVSIYNLQLCVLPRSLWRYARRSISDWKNEYLPFCEGCEVKNDCAGFFQSDTRRHSAHVRPLQGCVHRDGGRRSDPA